MNKDSFSLRLLSVLAAVVFGAVAFGVIEIFTVALANEDALVLPKGIFRSWAVGASGEVNRKFNQLGHQEGLAHALNQSVDMQTIAAASNNSELQSLYKALEKFEPGLGNQLFQSRSVAKANTDFQQIVMAMEYGATSKLSIGIIVPYARVQTKANFRMENVSGAEAVAQRVKGTGALESAVRRAGESLPKTLTPAFSTNQAVQSKFTKYGYQAPADTSSEGLGDIEVGAKYQVFNVNDVVRGATKFGVRLPTTSYRADPSNLFDQSSGDGQFDLAVQYITEYMPFKMWGFSLSGMGSWQLANKENLSVRRIGDTGLPDLTDSTLRGRVRRNLGDKLDVQAGTNVRLFNRRLTVELAYNYMLKGRDRYSGDQDLDYESLGSPKQISHGYEMGIGFSTLTDFVAKRFFMPLDINLTRVKTFKGKNVTDAGYYKLTMKAYY